MKCSWGRLIVQPAEEPPRHPARIAELQSFTYITTDARGANAERLGVSIRELVHYEMVTASETRYYAFWLTADGHVADFTSYPD